MYVLALLAPLILAGGIVAVAGPPTDFEMATGASGIALISCLWVAAVFFRRWWLTRRLPKVTEADHLLAWMLLTMTIVAVCIGWLLFYRLGYAFANASSAGGWVLWFRENRLVGASITIALAVAMIAKLRYPLSKLLGRWWIPIVSSGGVVVYFAWAYLPRVL